MAALTKKSRVTTEELRISKLTQPHDQMFKVILSHQIESKYNFSAISNPKGRTLSKRKKQQMRLAMYQALGNFIDKSTKLTITETEEKFGKRTDKRDGTFDPETSQPAEVVHFGLYHKDAKPNSLTDSVRLHGYFRVNGYFVITRLDWFHEVHKS